MGCRIEVEDLGVAYEDKGRTFKALEGVTFTVQPGEFVSIIGSSGCGKSTLLSVLEGLRKPTQGQASINGERIEGPGRERSTVFQQYALFPWMTAIGNVSFALEQARPELRRQERRAVARECLAKVGLEAFADRFPKELSGGQQQRVAIARALAEDGQVLLMDEPFGAIDAKNRAVLQDLLLDLWEKDAAHAADRKTVVFVTHDLDEAILLSDRIVMMEADHAAGVPGHIRAEFPVSLPRPRRRLDLLTSERYAELRAEVSAVFFEDEEWLVEHA